RSSDLGASATSGSRLFINMRSAASACQVLQLRWCPRGARTTRDPEVDSFRDECGMLAPFNPKNARPAPSAPGREYQGPGVYRPYAGTRPREWQHAPLRHRLPNAEAAGTRALRRHIKARY